MPRSSDSSRPHLGIWLAVTAILVVTVSVSLWIWATRERDLAREYRLASLPGVVTIGVFSSRKLSAAVGDDEFRKELSAALAGLEYVTEGRYRGTKRTLRWEIRFDLESKHVVLRVDEKVASAYLYEGTSAPVGQHWSACSHYHTTPQLSSLVEEYLESKLGASAIGGS